MCSVQVSPMDSYDLLFFLDAVLLQTGRRLFAVL